QKIMANGVSTEWDDIQRKLGNFEQKPYVAQQWELNQQAQEKLEQQEKQIQKDDLSDLENEFEDDDFFKEYQQKRMKEMQEIAQKPHFGSVYEISKDQYVEHVSNAPPESWVVLHMYNDSNEYCLLINQYFSRLAIEYPLVKFVKIVATKCVENFPESNCPCFIIYKGGKMVVNLQSIDKFIGKVTKENIEKLLHQHSVIVNEEFNNQDEEIQQYKSMLNRPFKNYGGGYLDKVDDREYVSKNIKKLKD
ncbi:phosducin family protein, putative, partial [Ichthyophthirius multifiliis]